MEHSFSSLSSMVAPFSVARISFLLYVKKISEAFPSLVSEFSSRILHEMNPPFLVSFQYVSFFSLKPLYIAFFLSFSSRASLSLTWAFSSISYIDSPYWVVMLLIFCARTMAVFIPSNAEETIPPAYPEPSPAG